MAKERYHLQRWEAIQSFYGRGLVTLFKEKIIKFLESWGKEAMMSDADQPVPQYRA